MLHEEKNKIIGVLAININCLTTLKQDETNENSEPIAPPYPVRLSPYWNGELDVLNMNMKNNTYAVLLFTALALFSQGCAYVTEKKSVYAGPWTCGFDERLGPVKVTVHPAAQYDREPYGQSIRGFRIALKFKTNTLSNTSVSNITASYVYAPLKQLYNRTEHPMSVLRASLQPGVPKKNVYTIFLQPTSHLDKSGFVKEGRYKINLQLTCQNKTMALVSETNLAYEKKRAIYFTPIIYLYYLGGGGWGN